MNAVIITGATSMLGIATIRECIKKGIKVLAISRAGSSRRPCIPNSPLVCFLEKDLSELHDISVSERYDVLYHFGWGHTNRDSRDNPTLQCRNIDYTLDAVDLAYRSGCKVFVGAGSQAEYGFQNVEISESTPASPQVSYGIAKLAAGGFARKQCERYGMICLWTRIFSVYGVHDSENTMVSYSVSQYLKGEVAKFSAGFQPWNFLFEEDAGKIFVLLGENIKESSIVNVAGNETKTLREYIKQMAEVFAGFQYIHEDVVATTYGGIRPNISKLYEITGYVPQISFTTGLLRILESKKNDEKNQCSSAML